MEIRTRRSSHIRHRLFLATLMMLCIISSYAVTAGASQGPWRSFEVLDPAEVSAGVKIAAGPDGETTAVWNQWFGSESEVAFAEKEAGSNAWAEARPLLSDTAVADIATGEDGTSAVALLSSSTGSPAKVLVSIRAPGGTFGEPITVAGMSSRDQIPRYPVVAVGPDGAVTVAWQLETIIEHRPYPQRNVTKVTLQGSQSSSADSFGPVIALGAPSEYVLGEPDATVGPDGTATIVWNTSLGSAGITARAATAPPGEPFGPAESLNQSGDAFRPTVRASADGSTTVVWQGDGVMVTRRPQGGSFETPVDMSSGLDPNGLSFGVSADGTVTAAWSQPDADSGKSSIQVATRSAGGVITAPVRVSSPGANGYLPQVAVAGDGSAAILWKQRQGLGATLFASTRPAGGSFAQARNLEGSYADGIDVPQIEITPSGSATAAWVQQESNNTAIMAATTGPDGLFGTPSSLSGVSSDTGPEIATADDGTTIAAWLRSSINGGIVRATTSSSNRSLPTPWAISSTEASAGNLSVAAGPDARSGAVWESSTNGGPRQIQAVMKGEAGVLPPPVGISDAANDASNPQIAFGDNGKSAVAWKDSTGGTQRRLLLATAGLSGSFSEPVVISDDISPVGGPQVTIDSSGTVILAWVTAGDDIRVAKRIPGTSSNWSAEVSGSASADGAPTLAVGPNRSAAITWRSESMGSTVINVATRNDSGDFLPKIQLEGQARAGDQPQVTVGSNGKATIIWQRDQTEGVRLVATPAGADGRFGSTTAVSGFAPSTSAAPDVATGPDDTTTVVWQEQEGEAAEIHTATREPGAAFGSPELISLAEWFSRKPQVSVGPGGTASAIWRSNGATIEGAATTYRPPPCHGTLVIKSFVRHPSRGTVDLRIRANGAGIVRLAGSRKTRAASRKTTGRKPVRLTVRTRGKTSRKLRRAGRIRVGIRLSFDPAGPCTTVQKTRKVTLVRRR